MPTHDDNTPALEPPPGQESHFDGRAGSLQTAIIATLAACLFISSVSVVMRVYAQRVIFRRFVWADFWIGLAWVSHVGFAAMLLTVLPYGAGYHQWDVRLSAYYIFEFYLYVSFVLYDLAIVGAKVSILLQLSAIFSGTKRGSFYWASVALILINIIFYIALSFALIFQCHPLEKAWNPTVAGKCVNQDVLLTSSGPFNIASDFLIFLLPIWAIWKLQLPLRRRLEVISAFAIALFGCLCSAIRLIYSSKLKNSGDATWVLMQNQLWANAEITVGILIASLFVLPRLVRQWLGKDKSYANSGYDHYPSHGSHSHKGTNSKQNSTWASRQSGTRSKNFGLDSYFELEETDKKFPSTPNPDPEANALVAGPRSREGRFFNTPLHLQNSVAGSVPARSLDSGDIGIVKTVEIRRTEEPAVVGAAR